MSARSHSTTLVPARLVPIAGIMLLLLVLLSPATQTTARSEPLQIDAGALSITRSDDRAFAFELQTPPLTQAPAILNGEQFAGLNMAGYGNMRIAGQPDLPQTSFYVAVPPGAVPSLAVHEIVANEIANVRVMPGAEQVLLNRPEDGNLASLTPEFETRYWLNEETYRQATPYPDSGVISLGQPEWLRDQRVVQVWIRPVSTIPAQNAISVAGNISAEIIFTYPEGQPAASPRPESASYDQLLQSQVVNYDVARAWRTEQPMPAIPSISPCLGSNAYRITLEETGMYSLSYSQLAGAGLGGPVASDSLSMCYEDNEISIRVRDGGDGTFGSGDSIVFFGQAIKTQETTTNAYWLRVAGSGHSRIDEKSEGSNSNVPDYFEQTIWLEEDHIYRAEAPMTSDESDHWYWQSLLEPGDPGDPPDSLSIPFDVSNLSAIAHDIGVTVEVYGRYGSQFTHRFEVKLNGQLVGTGEFVGNHNTRYVFDGTIDSSALNDGNNTLTVEVPYYAELPYFYFHVNYATVTMNKEFVAAGNMLQFSQAAAGNWRYDITGFSGTPDVYNVTDPDNPVRLLNVTGSGAISFSEDITAGASYSANGAGGYLSPLTITKDSPSSWRSPNWADYIIITDPTLDGGALADLRDLRESEGLRVKTVYVQDLFDEFGFGRYSTQAINDFLAYAYEEWDNGGLAPPPTYVLLVGEGSYDHRNVLGNNGPGSNLVPVFLVSGIDSNIGETTADNRYVVFNDQSTLAQMQLGRLPVSSGAELTTVVNKILTYEAEGPNPARDTSHFFVADNAHNPPRLGDGYCALDPAGDFFATVNEFIPAHLDGMGQNINRLFYAPLSCYPNPDASSNYDVWLDHFSGLTADMQARLRQKYSEGMHFVVYVGHSGTLQWGKDNERFLTTADIPLLTNSGKYSIMLPMTCLEGLYHFPEAVYQGVSESLLRSTNGGAVASYAPTGLQVQTAHDYLLSGFYDGIFLEGETTLGAAVMNAKINLDQNGNFFFQDLQDTFMLLGDPAMNLNVWLGGEQLYLPVMVRP